jgi:hypothetical protein
VPGLLLATEDERRRFEEGKQRHARRLREAGRA